MQRTPSDDTLIGVAGGCHASFATCGLNKLELQEAPAFATCCVCARSDLLSVVVAVVFATLLDDWRPILPEADAASQPAPRHRTPPPLVQCSKNLVSHGTKMYIAQQPKRQVDLNRYLIRNYNFAYFCCGSQVTEFESIACVCLSDWMLPEAKSIWGKDVCLSKRIILYIR